MWNLSNGVLLASGATGKFTNVGTLVRGTAASANNITADFTSTGTVQIGSGTLFLDGATNRLTGTVTGAGTLGFGGGVSTLGPGVKISMAAVSIKGATTGVNLDESLTWAGGWTQSSGTVSVGSGDTLKFTGTGDSFSGVISGAGAVDFAGMARTASRPWTLSATHVAVGAAKVTMTGGIGITGLLAANGSSFTIAATGAALSGGGALDHCVGTRHRDRRDGHGQADQLRQDHWRAATLAAARWSSRTWPSA